MARAGGGAVVWDRPAAAGAVSARRAVPYDARRPGRRIRPARGFTGAAIEVASGRVPGAHNAVNAAGALTACALAGADPERAAAALADFRGARRRLELTRRDRRRRGGVRRLRPPPDRGGGRDRGHAVRWSPRRLVAVFQPHLYSRTRALAREFGVALAGGRPGRGAAGLPGPRERGRLPGRRRPPGRGGGRRRAGADARWPGCRGSTTARALPATRSCATGTSAW